jgi:hypothetical protein
MIPDSNGNVWVPTGQGGLAHGGPHWDVQDPNGGYENKYPPQQSSYTVSDPNDVLSGAYTQGNGTSSSALGSNSLPALQNQNNGAANSAGVQK